MSDYLTIELNNNSQYVLIDMLDLNNKIYFLLSKIYLEKKIVSNSFDIFIFNQIKNVFEEIDDEYEYNYVKDIFEDRLEEKRIKIDSINVSELDNICKYKVINIDNMCYTLINDNEDIAILEIELFDNLEIKINDYMYFNNSLLKEDDILRFGSIYTDRTEIIKVVRDKDVFYLQRYYG